jgi:uncharacterized protein YbaP (TraB family)
MSRLSRRIGAVAAAFGLLLASCAAPEAARAQPPVWVVSDADSELVLFGSVHILPPGLDWRPAPLSRALAAADDVWFELPVDPAAEAEVARLAGERGVLPPDGSLFALLTAAEQVQLARVAESYGVEASTLDRLQPWLAEVALGAAAFRRFGAGAEHGVEKAVSAAAPARAGRRAFETPAEQIALFADTPLEEQLAALRETLQELEDEPDAFAQMVAAWMAGDLDGLDREVLEPLRRSAPNFYRRLVTERNVRWTETLDQRLKGEGRTVVVVGMGHLIGSDGLPARLRALGYKVTGP